LAAQKLG